MKFNFLSITPEKLRQFKYRNIFREYYDLIGVVDNGPWHDNQNVFDHVVSVFGGLLTVLQFNFLSTKEKEKCNIYLKEKISRFSRKEILYLATLLHDISKTYAVIVDSKTKQTTAPGHEVLSSVMTLDIASRFGFSGKDIVMLHKIVLYHGFLHDILKLILHKREEERFFGFLKKATKGVTIELLLLGYADMVGSDLFRLNKSEFVQREKLLIHLIKQSL